ncbi:MAG TPA: ATP-dependent RNA helicase HrpA [Quisquiliibacterium sp.]|nr:ATP-dependent RNA helicase HrpA [Quisquiliibacterium sp.]
MPTALRPLPPLTFPEALPVSGKRDEIARAIREHPVVIVCGETGSGKTTQLPKICALAGRGQAGLIGHTQPRRLAATTVARRIAEEIGSPLGTHVGYKIRFNEKFGQGASIKLMTDGILLAETLSDARLRQYDTIIVDEAHERSLNIDFLLGYLKQLVDGPRRDDLKLVITSATIDAQRFAEHFGRDGRPAPVIEVSGRLYPVEIRYRSFDEEARDDDDETDLPSRIEEAVDELWRERAGDVLVFLPGEREIRDVADHLRRAHARAQAGRGVQALARGPVEILPLFSRLSVADQQKVFSGSNGRRIVLATNVAETSLTVPGIRYVIDTGTARVKRYRFRSKVEQLQIEPVSQAAANQRAGRCGRVSDGVCIRLYSEQDFAGRPRFTDPEVLRSSLAGVILQMKALRLVGIEEFPFLDPPQRKAIVDGYALLHELGATDERNQLTDTGRQLARLPVDPHIGRMLLAARQADCLREMLVIAAALSVQDPRERPMESQQAADQQHRRFVDERSDFVAWVKLWDYWQTAQREKESNRRLQQKLEREFLSPRKLREWADVVGQLTDTVTEMHWKRNEAPAPYDALHQALLTGMLGNLGFKDADEAQYQGTHQTRFSIHPGSALARKPPRWLMAGELVDTGRLYARTVARIEPAWIERAAAHLIRTSYSEPHWEKKAGQVVAFERGVLYGLTVYAQRRVHYGPRDPKLARELLIREALVGGEWDSTLPFFVHNRRLVAEIRKLEHKIRRPDLLVDEGWLFDWFDARVPADVVSGAQLEAWYLTAVKAEPSLLKLSRDELLRKEAEGLGSDAFPRRITMRGVQFALDYHFDPGASDDGATLTVPIHALNQVDGARCEWLVAGMLRDKVAALIKSLPQKLRRHVVPVPEYVEGFVARWSAPLAEGALVGRPLLAVLIDDLRDTLQLRAAATDFKLETVPPHLFMNFRLVDEHGGVLGVDRSLAALKAAHGERAQSSFQSALSGVARRLTPRAGDAPAAGDVRAPGDATDDRTRRRAGARGSGATAGAPPGPAGAAHGSPGHSGAVGRPAPSSAEESLVQQAGQRFTAWTFGPLPELMELQRGRDLLVGYPALADVGDAVELQVFDAPEAAVDEHRRGLRRLFALSLKEPLRFFERNLPDGQRLALLFTPFGGADDLRAELVGALIERACMADPLPADAAAFAERVEASRPRINLIGQEIARVVLSILTEHQAAVRKLASVKSHAQAHADIEQQLAALLPKRFVTSTPPAQLPHLVRYLKAVALRVDKLRADAARDARLMADLAPLLTAYRRLLGQRRGHHDPRLEELRWLLEELRVSLFAQELRTPMPVSVKRLQKQLASITGA